MRNHSISTLGIQCPNHFQQLDRAGVGGGTSRLQVSIFRYATVALRAQRPEAHLLLRGGCGGSLRGARGIAESLALQVSWEASPGSNFLSGVWLLNPLISQLSVAKLHVSPQGRGLLRKQQPLDSGEAHPGASSFHPTKERATAPTSAKPGSTVSEGTSQSDDASQERWTLFSLGRKSSPHLLQLTDSSKVSHCQTRKHSLSLKSHCKPRLHSLAFFLGYRNCHKVETHDNSTIFPYWLGACPFRSNPDWLVTQWSISKTIAYIKLYYIAWQDKWWAIFVWVGTLERELKGSLDEANMSFTF